MGIAAHLFGLAKRESMICRIVCILALIFLSAEGRLERYDMASLPHMPPLKHIKLLDQKALDIDSIDGIKFAEISDLAYDAKNHQLYMLSDKGKLFVFDANFDKDKISLIPAGGFHLRDINGKKLKHKQNDSEGLTFDSSSRLWVSFEGKPRIAEIYKKGKIIKYAKLPKTLPKLKNMRGRNKGLESLAWHPEYGLVTAVEYPELGIPTSHQTIYALSGKRWGFVIDGIPHPGVTAIETMDDGNILALVRTFDKKHFRVIVALIKIYIKECKPDSLCRSEYMAKLSTDNGWALDNFEGLVRVAPHRYLMVSDNGNDPIRRTLLIYFEIKNTAH